MYLELFLTFLKIGAVSFGGGYGMISVIRDTVVGRGWLTESELTSFIAVSESTPGPLAVNMATFIGSARGGIAGALFATLGVILPSFIIVLLIAAVIREFLQYPVVKSFLRGVRPCVVAMIMSTAITMGLKTLLSYENIRSKIIPDVRGIIIFAILIIITAFIKKWKKATPSPILMIVISAFLGIIIYN